MKKEAICIECPHSVFLDPKKDICWKTGGLLCKKLKAVVGKYDPCHLKKALKKKGQPG